MFFIVGSLASSMQNREALSLFLLFYVGLMGFISKILAAFSGDSETSGEPAEAQTSVMARAPRVRILPLHNISFILGASDTVQPISLSNISTTGVSFIRDSRQVWPQTGTIIDGKFLFQGREYPASMQIVHISGNMVGCQFSTAVREVISPMVLRYFELELSALQLTPVNSNFLKKPEDGEPRWFRGKDNCELYYVENEGRIVRFNLTFFGNHIEGGDKLPLRYGEVVVDDEITDADGYKIKETALIRPRGALSPEVMGMTFKFVANIDSLSESHRSELLTELKITGNDGDS